MSKVKSYWLMKSEPDVYSWDDLVAEGEGTWDGVRNYTARNNMRAMQPGDQAFFYHSNIGKEIVGIVEVIRESAPDSTTDDPRWDCVMVRAQRAFKRPVSLEDCKVVPGLEAMVRHHSTFFGKALRIFLLFFKQAFGYKQRKIRVHVTGFFEHSI